jgi:hypothetical protein
MDLMIEAKDKEQAVFALRRKWDIEGGLPKEWYLTGAKMDEERDIPIEMGIKVFYDEGEEWRFKPPIKMPVRVQKMLEKLDKERAKVDGDQVECERVDEAKKSVLDDWEREKRIKWGLEKKDVVDGNSTAVTPKVTAKRTPSSKKKTLVDKVDDKDETAEWTLASETPSKKPGSRRPRKTAEIGDQMGIEISGEPKVLENGITMNGKSKSTGKLNAHSAEDIPAESVANGNKRRRSKR